jgi:hypothetical protein
MDKKGHSFRLFVGDISQDLAMAAQSQDHSAFLIDHTNCAQVLIYAIKLTKLCINHRSSGQMTKQ